MMTTKSFRNPRAANALMALSMALLAAASVLNLMNPAEKPGAVRILFAGALVVLCATFAYRAWRCRRRPGGERA
jgi:hypothetical protein